MNLGNLLGSLTVRPLLVVIAVLLATLGVQQMRIIAMQAARDVAQAAQRAAESDARTASTERTAYKLRVAELSAANEACANAIAQVRDELQRVQGEINRMQVAGATAEANARTDAAAAANVQALYVGRYAEQVRVPGCAQALAALEQACPTLAGY